MIMLVYSLCNARLCRRRCRRASDVLSSYKHVCVCVCVYMCGRKEGGSTLPPLPTKRKTGACKRQPVTPGPTLAQPFQLPTHKPAVVHAHTHTKYA